LHGFPFDSRSFWPQLEAPPEGFRLLVPDHRGFGKSAPAPGVSTMEAMAQDALAVLDAAGVPDAVVGGVSMGGYVTLALLRLNPGRVRGLLLCDTQAGPDDDAGKARRDQAAKDVEAHGVGPLAEALGPKLFAPSTGPAVRERVLAMMREQSATATAAASRGMGQRVDSKDVLSRFAGPTLVVVGDQDALTPPDKARVLAGLVTGAKLEVIPGAGHLANLEQPVLFGKALTAFQASFS
jgi:pimeloyl-ACP methyl ester carboxylesterase